MNMTAGVEGAQNFSIGVSGRSLQTIPPTLLPLKEGIYKMPGSLGLRPECGGDGGGNENKASRE